MKVYYSIHYDHMSITRYENDFQITGRSVKPEDLLKVKKILDALDPILKGEKEDGNALLCRNVLYQCILYCLF